MDTININVEILLVRAIERLLLLLCRLFVSLMRIERLLLLDYRLYIYTNWLVVVIVCCDLVFNVQTVTEYGTGDSYCDVFLMIVIADRG